MAPLNSIRKIFLNPIFLRSGGLSCRLISTTGKKAETGQACEQPQAIYKKDFTKPFENNNWVSYGGDENDKGEDRFRIHFYFFLYFTYALCGFSFLYAYGPDKRRADWARREAFIRLHEREERGLEPIDANFIDPSKIVLPPDEELTEDDIVI